MSLTLKDFESNGIAGLGTWTHTCGSTAIYSFKLSLFILPPSGMVVTLMQNSSTILTLPAPLTAQSHMEIDTLIDCTAGDILTLTLSSSVNTDSKATGIVSVGQRFVS
jgi:hypothetical protein